jgi:hypothetical protein
MSLGCEMLVVLGARLPILTYQVGDHDLRLATKSSSGSSRRSLGRLALPGRLGNTAYRSGSGGGGGSSSARATAATAAAGGLGGLEDVVEALLHLV